MLLRETSVLLLELLRNRATSIIINIAPPTTHTHGCAYHVVVVVVVSLVTDVLELELLLSCAQVTTCIKLKRNINKNLPKMPSLTFFMSIGLINKRVDGKLS